jgi:hypothetical protein
MDNIAMFHNETYDKLKELLTLMRKLADKMQSNLPHMPYRNNQFDIIKTEGLKLCHRYNVINNIRDIYYIEEATGIQLNTNILCRRIYHILNHIDENTVDLI